MGIRAQRIVRGVAAAASVIAFSLVVGGLTSPAQQYLPDELRSLANSAGGWSMFAFLAVWLSRARPALGGVLGAVSFVTMVEAYGVVSGWRGYFFAEPFSSMWIPVGLVAGPVIGVAASLVRHGRRRSWRVAGVGVLSAVLLAEATYGLTVVRETTSPVYWALEAVAGVGFVVAAVVARGRDDTKTGGSLRPADSPASGDGDALASVPARAGAGTGAGGPKSV